MLCSILFSSLYVLFNSTFGLNVIYLISSYFISGLKVEKIVGVFNNFKLKNFSYCVSGLLIQSNEIHCIIKFNYLVNDFFYVNQFQLNNTIIKINTNQLKLFTHQTLCIQKIFTLLIKSKIISQFIVKNLLLQFDYIYISIFSFTTSFHLNNRLLLFDYFKIKYLNYFNFNNTKKSINNILLFFCKVKNLFNLYVIKNIFYDYYYIEIKNIKIDHLYLFHFNRININNILLELKLINHKLFFRYLQFSFYFLKLNFQSLKYHL
ncbi:hypothetical protein [Buchnera aphidicola]|uniref:hypothetical protein n=1 Tax=Buchnera aphidicola TaxID=9 RepID=UPI0034644440